MLSSTSVVLCYTVLVALLAVGASAQSACPSSTPSPSNPVGCVLYSFPSSMPTPNTVSYDAYADMLIVGSISQNLVAAHYPNGTLYKQLTAPVEFPLSYPEQAAIDDNGLVFIVNKNQQGIGYITVFTPFPDYAYFSVIANTLAEPVSDGLAIAAQGEYLYVTNSYSVSVYHITCNASAVTNATLSGSTPTQPNFVYGAITNPVTGQIATLDGSDKLLNLYTPTYDGDSVTFVLNQSYTATGALVQLDDPRSLAITTGGQYIVMDEHVATYLTWLIMDPDGSSPTGVLPTGLSCVYYYSFMAATPTGSMVFVPGATTDTIVVFQGIASDVQPWC